MDPPELYRRHRARPAASLEGRAARGRSAPRPSGSARASLGLTQPYVFVPRLSLIVGPYTEYRNDLKDQSVAVGFNTTLITGSARSSIALEYRISARHIYEYHFGEVSSGDINLAELLALEYPALIDSLGYNEDKSTITLSGSFADVDDLTDPRRGWVVRPSARSRFRNR